MKAISQSNEVDRFLAGKPPEIREALERLRAAIEKAAPGAEEFISYKMPAFRLNGMLVWYTAHKNHIGFYPKASGIEAFKKELAAYAGTKGSVHFPLGKPLPLGLITKIVKFRVKENQEKAKKKAR